MGSKHEECPAFDFSDLHAVKRLEVVKVEVTRWFRQMLEPRLIIQPETIVELPENWRFIDLLELARTGASKGYPTGERRLDSTLALWVGGQLGKLNVAVKRCREIAKALSPWGGVCSDKVEWELARVLPHPASANSGLSWIMCDLFVDMHMSSWSGIRDEQIWGICELPEFPGFATCVLQGWLSWEIATELDCPIAERYLPIFPNGVESFCNWPNPYQGILDVWEMGFLPFSKFDSDSPDVHIFWVLNPEKDKTSACDSRSGFHASAG